MLQKQAPVEWLREFRLNGNEALILKKTNQKTLRAAYEAWIKLKADKGASGGSPGEGGKIQQTFHSVLAKVLLPHSWPYPLRAPTGCRQCGGRGQRKSLSYCSTRHCLFPFFLAPSARPWHCLTSPGYCIRTIPTSCLSTTWTLPQRLTLALSA